MPEQEHSTRLRVDLSHNWAFMKRRMGRSWLSADVQPVEAIVDLPHCWNVKDAYQENVSYYRGYGSYRKQFQMPVNVDADDMVWILESEGFYGTGNVWLNGRKLADVDGQYLGFYLDVGRYLFLGSENVLGIRLTNRCASHVLPGIRMPDFLLYGGLSGRVWLQGIPALHLDRKRTKIHCENVTGGVPVVIISFAVVNCSEWDRRCTVRWTVVDMDGNDVGETESLEVGLKGRNSSGDLTVRLESPGSRLWSPDSPCLYRAICSILVDGKLLDCVEERFGFREAFFKPEQGFFLNGERVELRGCNRHESMPGFGHAMPARLHREDAELIKKAGLNFVRLSHYPQHPFFLDACDELGIMVYAEIASWKSVRRGRWLKSACRQMNDMIIRDRNRPSIILWGMGNEARSRRAYLKLREVARYLDPIRPVTYAENHFYRARRRKTIGIPDVWGINYELDALEDGCHASRLKSVIITECSNCPHTVRGDLALEARQVAVIEKDLARIEDKPYVAGFALWSFNDYATLRKKRYRRHSGIVDAWRIPKMSTALLRARYMDEPFLKLFADWAVKREDSCREIHIFTNCDTVVLFRNGEQIMSLRGNTHLVQLIDFQAGELVVQGMCGKKTVMDRLVSYTEARRIDIQAEETENDKDTQGTVGMAIRIFDQDGILVADWNGNVAVTVDGAAVLRSYSDEGFVPVSGGLGRVFITAKGEACVATVKASCQGLVSTEVEIDFGSGSHR